MSSSRIELSDHRTNKKDEVDNDTDSIPDLICCESDDDDGDDGAAGHTLTPATLKLFGQKLPFPCSDVGCDLDIVLPSILSTNKNKDENDTDSVPDLIYNLVGHTHSSVLKYYGQKLPFPCSDVGCDLDIVLPPSILSTNKNIVLPFPSDAVVDNLLQGHTHESIDQQFKDMWLTLTHKIEEERVIEEEDGKHEKG